MLKQKLLEIFIQLLQGELFAKSWSANVVWVVRCGFGQADWSPWALACGTVFREGPPQKPTVRGPHPSCPLSVGDAALHRADPGLPI